MDCQSPRPAGADGDAVRVVGVEELHAVCVSRVWAVSRPVYCVCAVCPGFCLAIREGVKSQVWDGRTIFRTKEQNTTSRQISTHSTSQNIAYSWTYPNLINIARIRYRPAGAIASAHVEMGAHEVEGGEEGQIDGRDEEEHEGAEEEEHAGDTEHAGHGYFFFIIIENELC